MNNILIYHVPTVPLEARLEYYNIMGPIFIFFLFFVVVVL